MSCCERCGLELPPGGLKYLITLHVTADFDGVLPSQVEEEDLEAFMRRVDEGDPIQLEKDVYQSRGYLLCPSCKTAFMTDPLGGSAGSEGSEGSGKVH